MTDTSGIHIIVVEREAGLIRRLRALFPDAARVSRESTLDHVLERCESEIVDVLVITSPAFKAGRVEGEELLEVVAANAPHIRVIFLVAPSDMRIAFEALTNVYQYTKLPVGDEELRLLVESALKNRVPRAANLTAVSEAVPGDSALLGRSPVMQEVYRQVRQAAATDIPVLILGETGTGKDLTAQAIHMQSRRRTGPYVPVHLGALPPELVASELFGHERGAFTGALERRAGKFEQADRGTIFLDEISTTDQRVQISLLRLIEHRKFTRLGGRATLTGDARIIAATNDSLSDLVAQGKFREDLFYRLDVFRIVMPPLRDRVGDVPLLVDAFMKRYSQAFGKGVRGIAPECITMLDDYDWPGNVRELKNVIQRAVLVCQGDVLAPEHLPARFRAEHKVRAKMSFDVGTPLAEIEREVIARVLALAPTRTRAAEMLGISRRALYNKLRRYGLQ